MTAAPEPTFAERLTAWAQSVLARARRQREEAASPRPVGPVPRPRDWIGHWSARYADTFIRTVRYPQFDQPQRKMLDSIPRPMHEALDPVPSTVDLTGRDGQWLPWTLLRSTTYDLFGVLGIAMGSLSLAVIVLFAAIRLFGLPPLTAPPAQQQQQQQQKQQQVQPPADSKLPDEKDPAQRPPFNTNKRPKGPTAN